MSTCIIPMRHQSRFILLYMGKLRFTLTNIIFWIVLLLSCLLSENFAVLNNDPLKGFAVDSAFILTISIIVMLVLYYFLEHKKNKLTFDKVLLPAVLIAGLLLIVNVFRQGSRVFPNYDNTGTFTISFSVQDRVMASLQVFVWLAVMYATVFVYNRFRLNKESYRWVGKIYLIALLLFCIIDLFLEGNQIAAILNGTSGGSGLAFLMVNPNIWSLLLFSGFLTAVLLSYKRFRWYYYLLMVYLFFHNLLTSCSTTTFIEIVVFVIYSLYEIFSHISEDKKLAVKRLISFFSVIAGIAVVFAIFVLTKVPMFVNLWSFITGSIFQKDFVTMTGRSSIWIKIFELLKGNPLDLIFGLGHITGNKILVEYSTTFRTAHNAFMEVVLRYGLLGACIYIGIIGLAIFGLIKHILKKNYRFAFIYGICFIAILAHSMTESTTLFTPNVGGLYFSFVFVLPIMNIIHEKSFNELKEDVVTTNVEKKKVNPAFYMYAIALLAACIVIAKILNLALSLDTFSTILVALVFYMISLFILSFLRKNNGNNPFNIIVDNAFYYYQNLIRKENNNG